MCSLWRTKTSLLLKVSLLYRRGLFCCPFFAIQEGARSVFVGSGGTADQFKVCFSMVRGKDEAMEMGLTAGLGAFGRLFVSLCLLTQGLCSALDSPRLQERSHHLP